MLASLTQLCTPIACCMPYSCILTQAAAAAAAAGAPARAAGTVTGATAHAPAAGTVRVAWMLAAAEKHYRVLRGGREVDCTGPAGVSVMLLSMLLPSLV
jgi:hypothetical protein